MSENNLPVKYSAEEGTLPPERVQAMFDRIARPYDAMNRVMTGGLDVRWRRLAAEATEVGAGARIHKERVFYSKKGGKFAFHRFTFWAECEPEIKCG